MTINIYAPTSQDTLSPDEMRLYHLIMDYRADNGLAAIPLSADLTLVAGRHTLDTTQNIWAAGLELPEGANTHSWSDAPYFSDHRDPSVMWEAPARLGTDYPGFGFEISGAGYRNIEAALVGWQTSAGHNAVILNQGIWAPSDWNAIGIGVETNATPGGGGFGNFGGRIYHVWFGREVDDDVPTTLGTNAGETIMGTRFDDAVLGQGGHDNITGGDGDDLIEGGDGSDTINGGNGDDMLTGGSSENDLRDVIYGGAGDDIIDGGYGNDELRGDAGNDVIAGGFGADTVIGGVGNDTVTGSALGDLLFGGDGNDFINGGFGFDRVNGGAGADRFFHLGVADHGSDWIQDFSRAQGDVLVFGDSAATRDQFQINAAVTAGAGEADVAEAFVVYRPTGQIIWALVDGMGQEAINLQIGNGETFDVMG